MVFEGEGVAFTFFDTEFDFAVSLELRLLIIEKFLYGCCLCPCLMMNPIQRYLTLRGRHCGRHFRQRSDLYHCYYTVSP